MEIATYGIVQNDPELRFTPNGKMILTFPVSFRIGNGKESYGRARITAWENFAENLSKSLKKGDFIYVVGRVAGLSAYTAKDGKAYPNLDITASLVSKPLGSGKPATKEQKNDADDGDDEFPF